MSETWLVCCSAFFGAVFGMLVGYAICFFADCWIDKRS